MVAAGVSTLADLYSLPSQDADRTSDVVSPLPVLPVVPANHATVEAVLIVDGEPPAEDHSPPCHEPQDTAKREARAVPHPYVEGQLLNAF